MTDISCAEEACRFNQKGRCEAEEVELEMAPDVEYPLLNCMTKEER